MAAARPRPVVCGCAGLSLTVDEKEFFSSFHPLGFILMGRNCRDPAQLAALVAELRACLEQPDVPILIDQEGGRVARLRPPHWTAFPPAALVGALYRQNEGRGLELASLTGRMIGQELQAVGINVNCAPVLDVAHRETHQAIGDRAFSASAEAVGQIGHAFAEGLLAAGVLPVIKHLPGHGHAAVDPHHALPVVSRSRAAMAADFAPFRLLAAMPLGMTSHILFDELDRHRPASQSPVIISDIIRGEIGFDGLLFSDDLGMAALEGELSMRCRAALTAGTDILLVCNASLVELESLEDLPPMTDEAWQRWQRARHFLGGDGKTPDVLTQHASLAELVAAAESCVMDDVKTVTA